MKNIIKSLESILANNYALTIKTQNYHWNVTGPNFKALHMLFEEQYNLLADANDIIAERIRQLGSKVEASFDAFSKLNEIRNGSSNLDAAMMLEDLAASHHALSNLLDDGIKIAQENGDEGTADILISKLEEHQKMIWMLEASL